MASYTKLMAMMGMNAVACPACAAINKAAKREIAYGTAFIPVTAEEMAYIRCDNDIKKSALCSDRRHIVTVTLVNYTPLIIAQQGREGSDETKS